MPVEELKKRFRDFALAVIRYVDGLPRSDSFVILGRQLLRAGTSVGANYRAACRARSRADFIAKLKIAEEECDEALYWLELLRSLPGGRAKVPEALFEEGEQILSILVASLKTARQSSEIPSSPRGPPDGARSTSAGIRHSSFVPRHSDQGV